MNKDRLTQVCFVFIAKIIVLEIQQCLLSEKLILIAAGQ